MEVGRTERIEHYNAAVEALLFAATDPLEAAEMAGVLSRVEGAPVRAETVEEVVAALRARYDATGSGLRVETWGGGYRLATRPDLAPFVEAARVQEKSVRLSNALIETLAVVAYRQPVSKPEVDHVRGVDSSYAIGRLADLDLVAVVGRGEGVGKPLLYGTTRHFLESFGLSDLSALPTLREMDELLGDPAFSREKARLLLLQDEAAGLPTSESAASADESPTPEA